MKAAFFQIDAFTGSVFGGNPAAVCFLPAQVPDEVLGRIAAENNLSETAFVYGGGGEYAIRWFTPKVEVDLCGHATLAAAHAVFSRMEPGLKQAVFHSRSGQLEVAVREDGLLAMDFPARPGEPCRAPEELCRALGREPRETYLARDYLAILETEEEVRELNPGYMEIFKLPALGLIVSAPGRECDFVSRFFAPRVGIVEDPVTGSAHCTLVPYWSARLNKKKLFARQVSARGGELYCEDLGERVSIAGRAVTFIEGVAEF